MFPRLSPKVQLRHEDDKAICDLTLANKVLGPFSDPLKLIAFLDQVEDYLSFVDKQHIFRDHLLEYDLKEIKAIVSIHAQGRKNLRYAYSLQQEIRVQSYKPLPLKRMQNPDLEGDPEPLFSDIGSPVSSNITTTQLTSPPTPPSVKRRRLRSYAKSLRTQLEREAIDVHPPKRRNLSQEFQQPPQEVILVDLDTDEDGCCDPTQEVYH
jgi:hypothetical protein